MRSLGAARLVEPARQEEKSDLSRRIDLTRSNRRFHANWAGALSETSRGNWHKNVGHRKHDGCWPMELGASSLEFRASSFGLRGKKNDPLQFGGRGLLRAGRWRHWRGQQTSAGRRVGATGGAGGARPAADQPHWARQSGRSQIPSRSPPNRKLQRQRRAQIARATLVLVPKHWPQREKGAQTTGTAQANLKAD